MARRGISQKQLAPMIGMKQQSLSRRLLGAADFRVNELLRIAKALDIDVAGLLSEPAGASA